jgi:geranylgeranyl pyrophosphate synthase
MEKYDSLDYVKRCAEKIVKESWREVDKLLPTSEAKERLKAFAEFLIKRNI